MRKERTVDVGKKVRYDRIVNPHTGKTVMIPLDHGVILGPMAGIEDPRETVRRVVAGGADAVIFNAGMAGTLYPEYGNRCGSVFNLTNIITGENDLTLISSVEYALKQAADAISVQVMVGSPHERHMLNNFRQVAEECQRWSLPLLAMMYPTEELLKERGTEAELLAARAGAELGADIVKTSYTGDPRTFEKLVAVCPVPVVVAGGPRKGTTRDLLEMVREAMDCGAAGVALGRNVWQSSDPARTTRALADIVHQGKKPDELEG